MYCTNGSLNSELVALIMGHSSVSIYTVYIIQVYAITIQKCKRVGKLTDAYVV